MMPSTAALPREYSSAGVLESFCISDSVLCVATDFLLDSSAATVQVSVLFASPTFVSIVGLLLVLLRHVLTFTDLLNFVV